MCTWVLNMPSKARLITVSLLILLGAALFCYCAVFYPTEDAAQAKGAPTALAASDVAPAQAASTCDAAQDTSNRSSRSASKSKPRPSRGAT